jgi:hypothetical protein
MNFQIIKKIDDKIECYHWRGGKIETYLITNIMKE